MTKTSEAEKPGRHVKHCDITRQQHTSRKKDFQHHGAYGKQEIAVTALMPLAFLVVLLICPLVSAGPSSVSVTVRGIGRTLQGESYSLACVVTPPQAGDSTLFDWYKDDRHLDNQNRQILHFNKLSKSDEGNYQCKLTLNNTERTNFSNPFFLRVHVVVLENISLVSEVEVEEGQTVTLNCSVHSDPTAFLSWRMGGKVLQTTWSNSDSLVLHNAWLHHLQIVECRAYNNGLVLGFLDAYCLIRRKGTYEVVPTPYLIQRGDTVLHHRYALECIVGELPNRGVNVHLTYTWYQDDKVMEGQSDMILDFPSLRKEDSGLYTCTARNGKPRTTSLQSNAWNMVVLVPPVVHIEPKTPNNVITGATGDKLTLTCKVTEAFPGVAPDGYRWSYFPSPGGQLRHLEGRESTLTLGPLTREDSGQYICQAWNSEDFGGLLPPGNASVTVDVAYLQSIELTTHPEVNEGDQVTFTCSVDSHPAARLSWLVEGQEVRHVTANVDHYVLERAACSDNKTYTCRASNPHLPGLELNTSTELRVNCTKNETQAAMSQRSKSLVVGVTVSVAILIVIVIVIVIYAVVVQAIKRITYYSLV